MRNPKWHRDEIILALDLFFRLDPGQIHAKNPAVMELSQVLNSLPIFEIRPDELKFRNPNGVGLKLSNFLAIDPTYHGNGMKSFTLIVYNPIWADINKNVPWPLDSLSEIFNLNTES